MLERFVLSFALRLARCKAERFKEVTIQYFVKKFLVNENEGYLFAHVLFSFLELRFELKLGFGLGLGLILK